jgi:hypothetical protein
VTVTGHDREADPTIDRRSVAPPPRHGLLSAQARSAPAPLVGPPRSHPARTATPAVTSAALAEPPAGSVPGSRLKEAFGIAGVMAIVVTAGVSLGFAWTSDDPLSIVDVGTSAQAPDMVEGLEGLAPGGPGAVVRMPVTNPGKDPLTLTGLTPQLSLLPSTCPASAWSVTVPDQLPVVVPPASDAQLPVSVALAADAPASCQGLAGSLHATVSASVGGVATSVDTMVTLSTARLGSPGAMVSADGGVVRVLATPPSAGPRPTGYTVDAVGPDGRHLAVCARPTLAACVDTTAPGAVRRGYVVTAHTGADWRRDSAQVQVWTPPPTPSLTLPIGPAGTDPDLAVTAPAAPGGYQVAITVDGVQVALLPVPRNVALDRSVRLTGLGSGLHQAVARAAAHDTSAVSAPLGFTTDAAGTLS